MLLASTLHVDLPTQRLRTIDVELAALQLPYLYAPHTPVAVPKEAKVTSVKTPPLHDILTVEPSAPSACWEMHEDRIKKVEVDCRLLKGTVTAFHEDVFTQQDDYNIITPLISTILTQP